MFKELSYFDEIGTLIRRVNSKRQSNTPSKVVLFTYDSRLDNQMFQKIFSKIPLDHFIIDRPKSTDGSIAYEIHGNSQKEESFSILLISKEAPYMALISNEKRASFNALLKDFYKLYPFVSRVFLRSREIRKVLANLEEKKQTTIVVKESILKRYYGDKEVQRCWTDVSDYDEVFQRAKQESIWVDSLKILVGYKNYNGIVRINRKGVIQYERGFDFLTLNELILNQILSLRMDLFEKQIPVPRTIDNLEITPLLFYFHEDVFAEQIDFQRLVERLKSSLKTWGYSILSIEEGFLWLLLHDYVSGSSYELMVTTKSEIAIIPQTQASRISFNELVSFLVTNYDGEMISGDN